MAPSARIEHFRVILDGEEYELAWRPGASLLDCLLAEGLDPAFQCMDGRCGSCVAKLLGGEVEMVKNEVLSARELARDYVLLCQSIPRSAGVSVDCDAQGPALRRRDKTARAAQKKARPRGRVNRNQC